MRPSDVQSVVSGDTRPAVSSALNLLCTSVGGAVGVGPQLRGVCLEAPPTQSSDLLVVCERGAAANCGFAVKKNFGGFVDRKRYEKAESEYITSKLDLHRKTEVKEQLTEHLYAIIQQNELRKAEKLQELMLQLHAAEAAERRDAPAGCGGAGAGPCGGGGARLPAETLQETVERCVLRESVTS